MNGLLEIGRKLLDVVRNESDVTVPALLLAVDRKIDLDAGIVFPFVENFRVIDEIVRGARAVDDLHAAVVFSLCADVVYHGVKRSKSDTARDKEEVLALQRSLNGEAVAVGTADRDLLTGLHHVKPARATSAGSDNTEGFDVGSVSPYIRDDSDERYQRFFIHSNLHFAARRHK